MLTTITQSPEGWWNVTIQRIGSVAIFRREEGLPSMEACLTYSHAVVAEENISERVLDWARWSR